MGAGDIVVTTPRGVDDDTNIIADLSGAAVVADKIVSVPSANGQQVSFVIVKAA